MSKFFVAHLPLCSPLVLVFSVVSCGPSLERNAEKPNALPLTSQVLEVPIGSEGLGLAEVKMNAQLLHKFNFTTKKIEALQVVSQLGLGARVVTGMETDNPCPNPGTLDPNGKVYTFYFGRFVDPQGRAVPFSTKVDIVQNLTASGVHAGQLAVNYVDGKYDQYNQAVVNIQFCARNVGRQSYVREFNVTLIPK